MAFWGNIKGFTYHYFDPFEDAPELEPFRPLIEVWRLKCGERKVPAWSDFDFTDFAGWHSKIAIYDVSHNPFDYKIRLSGEEFNRVLGRNMKGVTRKDLLDVAVDDTLSDRLYEKAATDLLFAYTKGTNVVDRQHIQVEYLQLPLSDNGIHATHSIEAINILDVPAS
ncbi:MAG: hypothetical protein RIM72_06255 [Alphaproteobacteria bacterium]